MSIRLVTSISYYDDNVSVRQYVVDGIYPSKWPDNDEATICGCRASLQVIDMLSRGVKNGTEASGWLVKGACIYENPMKDGSWYVHVEAKGIRL